MKPNFQAMNLKELHKYALDHRDDQEAFYAYVDRLHAEGNWVEMPAIQSDQDLENFPQFIEHVLRSAKQSDNSV